MITALFMELKKAVEGKNSNGLKRRVSAMYQPSKERAAFVQSRLSEDPFERFERELARRS